MLVVVALWTGSVGKGALRGDKHRIPGPPTVVYQIITAEFLGKYEAVVLVPL